MAGRLKAPGAHGHWPSAGALVLGSGVFVAGDRTLCAESEGVAPTSGSRTPRSGAQIKVKVRPGRFSDGRDTSGFTGSPSTPVLGVYER